MTSLGFALEADLAVWALSTRDCRVILSGKSSFMSTKEPDWILATSLAGMGGNKTDSWRGCSSLGKSVLPEELRMFMTDAIGLPATDTAELVGRQTPPIPGWMSGIAASEPGGGSKGIISMGCV